MSGLLKNLHQRYIVCRTHMLFECASQQNELIANLPALYYLPKYQPTTTKNCFGTPNKLLSVNSWCYIFSYLCLYCRRTVLSANCPVGKLSCRRNVRRRTEYYFMGLLISMNEFWKKENPFERKLQLKYIYVHFWLNGPDAIIWIWMYIT